jgi:hypothetical protein
LVIWKNLDHLLLNGIVQKRVGNGTGIMQLMQQKICNFIHVFARFVKRNLSQSIMIQHFVPIIVSQKIGDYRESTMNREDARYAEKNLLSINTYPICVAQEVAESNLDIEIEPVYNLTVEGDHVYYANGILVGNCAYQVQVAQAPFGWENADFPIKDEEKRREAAIKERQVQAKFDKHSPISTLDI